MAYFTDVASNAALTSARASMPAARLVETELPSTLTSIGELLPPNGVVSEDKMMQQ